MPAAKETAVWLTCRNESSASCVSTRPPATRRSFGEPCSPSRRRLGGGRDEKLGSGELSEIIHRFHQGPARELWIRYNTPHLEMAVAFAITTGVLGRETIPAELLEHLAGALRFYEEERATTS
jgi:hypothetical protein